MIKKITLTVLFASLFLLTKAQQPIISLDYNNPSEYTIAGIQIVGASYTDTAIIRLLSGLDVGDNIEVPSEKLSNSIENLWKQGLFSDINIKASHIDGNKIWLVINVVELPRLTKPIWVGFTKKEIEKLTEKTKQYLGRRADESLLITLKNIALDYITSKGYANAKLGVKLIPDSNNYVKAECILTRGERVKINAINIAGNTTIDDNTLKRKMGNTKERAWYRIFKKSAYDPKKYTEDKRKIIEYYQKQGYNGATIKHDSVYNHSPKLLNIDLLLEEGKLYYYRNISWVGNTLYSADTLNKITGIKKGDVYNIAQLDKVLHFNPSGIDVTSLYMDNGYLFFNINPVITYLEGDSVDIEFRIYEGKPAIINQVIIKGNLRTKDYVIRRELYTKPGQLFRRLDLLMSQQALVSLNYFDPAKMQINPIPDANTGTVDIEYVLEEKSSDQITLSGGIGAGKLVGTLGLVFNNFSFKDMFKRDAWHPVPAGDGKILSIQAQTNGKYFQSYNISVTEPWLGGRKPNSLTNSIYYNLRNQDYRFEALGFSTALGMRWKKPDNNFGALYSLNILRYKRDDTAYKGASYNINMGLKIFRNSADEQKDYPTEGSRIAFSVQATPPWSIGNNLSFKHKLIEYHKWKFDLNWYQQLAPKLVLNTTAHFGYLGYYNRNIGTTAYERFYVGGVQLANANFVGQEMVNLRGYENGAMSSTNGSALYNRFVMELRYPILQNKGSGFSSYVLAFAEAGNTWDRISDYNPINLNRSAGAGVRVTVPMFGTMGFDAGYGFDRIERNGTGKSWQFHFIIGKDIN